MGQSKNITRAIKNALNQLLFDYLKWLLLFSVAVYTLSGIYKVDKDSVGVVTRFGKVAQTSVPPGLHYKLPWPLEEIHPVQVKQVKTLHITDFNLDKKAPARDSRGGIFRLQTEIDPYCTTGDNNIVAVQILLKYTVSDPVKYLFGNKKSVYFLERAAASSIVHQLARRKIDHILTTGKQEIEFELLKKLKEQMEKFDTGISISFLEIERISPPETVQNAFNQVINAKVHKRQVLNEAQGYFNRVVPEARTYGDKQVQGAMAHKRERILAAEGETSRFLARLEAHRKDPEGSRRKIYLDFVQSLYPNLKAIRVVDGNNREDYQLPLGKFSIAGK